MLGSTKSTVGYLLLTGAIWLLVRYVYYCYWHKLARFPGPRLAAVSVLWRAYYQVWKDGEFVEQMKHVHEIYGPVVRIAPNELHFSTPQAYKDIYLSQSIKDPEFYAALNGTTTGMFSLTNVNQHKERRKILATLFSKAHFENVYSTDVAEYLRRLTELLDLCVDRDLDISLNLMFRSLYTDIGNKFVFGQVFPEFRCLQDVSRLSGRPFQTPFLLATHSVFRYSIWMFRNFNMIANVLAQYLPKSILARFAPGVIAVEHFDSGFDSMIESSRLKPLPGSPDCYMKRLIWDPRTKDGQEIPADAIKAEVIETVFGASIDLTNASIYGTYHVATDHDLRHKIQDEILSVWPREASDEVLPSYDALSSLPYLTGVVRESLRLTHGIISGPPRLTPSEEILIDNVKVPGKTVISTSSVYVHLEPSVFNEPAKFNPSRWIDVHPEQLVIMERHICVFGVGRRMCPASLISYMSLYATLAATFRRFEFRLINPSDDDLRYKAYLSLHFPKDTYAKVTRSS